MQDRPGITLDPEDWEAARGVAHRIVDDAITRLAGLRDGPVWQQMPDAVRASFAAKVPQGPTPLAEVYDELARTILPYAMGNKHPRFFGWYMGAGSLTGALGEFLGAIDASNLGGGDTGAAAADRQVTGWLTALMGFPQTAGATLTSGGSMANMVGLTVARNAMAGVDVRTEGVTDLPQPLRFYTSDQAHSATQKALEALGLGSRSLRLVPTDAGFRMDTGALERMIAEDRAAGLRPACVIATAGSTNTGAFDDLVSIGAICRREGIWFHVDGCIGALVRIAPGSRHLVAGIEAADSLALDPHKWLQTPFECGCAIVRDGARQFQTFAMHPAYLQEQPRGLAAGEFLADYGFDLTRSFKALKLWMSLKENGVARFGRLIDRHVELGRHLTRAIQADPRLELMAPTTINIVCFRFRGRGGTETELKALNTEIMLRMQESGIAAPTDTTLRGRHSLRAAINSHRVRADDLDLLVAETIRLGEALQPA